MVPELRQFGRRILASFIAWSAHFLPVANHRLPPTQQEAGKRAPQQIGEWCGGVGGRVKMGGSEKKRTRENLRLIGKETRMLWRLEKCSAGSQVCHGL